MIKTTYKKLQLLLCCLFFCSIYSTSFGQGTVRITVSQLEVINDSYCTTTIFGIPIEIGGSDFVWEVKADDGQGNSNNNPSVPFVGGLLGGSSNHFYKNNDNGPYIGTPGAPNGIDFNPTNGRFFDYEYPCGVPANINIDWIGYENDDATNYGLLLTEGETPTQNIALAVPTVGTSNTQFFSAIGSNNCNNNQEYRITFVIEHLPLAVTPVVNNICTAIQIPVNNTVQQFAWCGNQLPLEPGEPRTGEIATHGSAWFYFVAPASGQVEIETNLNETDFGTEMVVYHAADGVGCLHGTNNWVGFTGTNPVKSKFDYLSYQGDADDDIVSDVEATGYFCDVFNVPLRFPPQTRDGHALIAGETYYIQLTTDQNNRRGYVSLRIDDLGGSPYQGHDIPCQGIDVTADAQSATVRTEAGGQAFSTQLYRGNLTSSVVDDNEIGAPYTGTDARQFRAYDYVPTLPNNLNGSMWIQFTAANSGRVYFEADLDAGVFGENENTALYAPDSRFGLGRPADLFCSNITQIADAEGGIGGPLGGTSTAIIMAQCLEPGYTYYGMVDPQGANLAEEAEVWMYDPSVSDPANNPPPNDILCLTMLDTLFEIPVKPANQSIPFSAVAGDNTNACVETLAGEPPVDTLPGASFANQTVWHYFTVPPSGVVEIKLRAYVGLDSLKYAIYPLFQDSLCYGGLLPATYTVDGTQATPQITPEFSGTTGFAGDIVGLCCLTPGTVYAIQLDGGHPGDEGQYIIEYINEIEVYAGDAQYSVLGDTFNFMSSDTGFVCFGDTLFPSVMVDGNGVSTTSIANCLDIGFVIQDSVNIPDSIINGNFSFIDSVYARPQYWVNDGANPVSQNAVHYVGPMADEIDSWGTLTCPSASSENGAAFVFLSEIILVTNYNQNNCIIDFSATGGFPTYNGSLFDYLVTNSAGDTVLMGQTAAGATVQYAIAVADVFTIVITDGMGCSQTAVVNATPCLDPCINNPVFITPDPVDSSVYTCYPGGDSALVTIFLNGGAPSITAGEAYTSTVSGSNTPNGNGVYTTLGTGASVPTAFSFSVLDGDTWTVIVLDSNGCPDTISSTFDYNLLNCPDYCALNPVASTFTYNCNMDGTALVQITVNGGQPTIDGSNYTVNISGSTVFGQNFQNAQLAGVIGGAANFSFLVNDGDSWSFDVFDLNMCADTLAGTYTFDTSNCPICTMMPVQILPDPVDSSVYTCNSNGDAVVTLFITGGAPSFNASQYTVTTTGSSIAGQNGTTQRNVGLYRFDVANGDTWSVVVLDDNGCADTASGTFNYNPLDLAVNVEPYVCLTDKTANVTVRLSGGEPAANGSNYLVTIIGSTTPGASGYQIPVLGTIGDTTDYTFNVQDNDNWIVVVTDNSQCGVDSISGTFLWNATNCGDICSNPSYNGVVLNSGSGLYNYDCDSVGNAVLNLQITGGLPDLTAGNDDYIANVTINGNTNSYLVNSNGTFGLLSINLSNGDAWSVQIFDALQCDTAFLAATFTSVNAVANASTPPGMLLGQFATLDGTASTGNISTYSWTPTTNVNDPLSATTSIQPLTTTTYVLSVADTLGCISLDSVLVEVGRCIPNHAGFTPNGDGVNDFWEIPCLNLFTNRVQVFNRWGLQVFEAVNYDGSWDGTNLGQDVPDGTYYYVISVDEPQLNEPTIYKGTVTIIR